MEYVYAVLETHQCGDELESYLDIFKELSSAKEHFNKIKDELIEVASANTLVDANTIAEEGYVENTLCYLDIDGCEIVYIDKDEDSKKIIRLETHKIGE